MPRTTDPRGPRAAEPATPVTRRSLLGDAVRKGLELLARQAGARLRSFDELAALKPEKLLQITPLRCRAEAGHVAPLVPRSTAEEVLLEHATGRHRLVELARILAGSDDPDSIAESEHQVCAAFLRLVEDGRVVPHGDVAEPRPDPARDTTTPDEPAAPEQAGDPG
jgi:hypothetical protein